MTAPPTPAIVNRLLGEVRGRDLSREQIIVLVRVLTKHGCLAAFCDRLNEGPLRTAGDARLRFELARVLSRQPEAAAALEHAVRADPTCAVTARRAVEFFMAARDNGRAMALVDAALVHVPDALPLLRLRAILSSHVRPDAADPDIGAAWDAQPADWWVVLDCWARVGRHDRIDAALAQHRARHPRDPTVHTAVGRMALWRGDTAAAKAAAERAREIEPANREAAFLLGASAVLEGRLDEAQPWLDAAIDGDGPVRWLAMDAAHTFRSCMERDRGQCSVGMKSASQAMFCAQDYNVAAHIARITNAFYVYDKGPTIDPRFLEVGSHVRDLADDPDTAWNGKTRTFIEGIGQAERRLSGNRTALSTWVDDAGRLHRHAVPPYPRHLARLTQMLVRVRPPDAVLAEFERLAAVHPNDPTVFTYRGEFRVWMGDFDAASADFEAALAIDPRTTWAWIGLAAAQIGRGKLHRSLDTLAEGIVTVQYEGPTVFVYRGEARRLLGEHGAAMVDLTKATGDKPQRLSAWINRALVAEAMGNPAPVAALTAALAASNPGLWHDIQRHPGGSERPLEACLALMRGNRSSTVLTYRTPDGTVRLIDWQRRHATDALRAAFGGL